MPFEIQKILMMLMKFIDEGARANHINVMNPEWIDLSIIQDG
jgi:hypothetical protein